MRLSDHTCYTDDSMGFFSRLKTGWALSMDSLSVLRQEPSLTLFPLVAGLAGTVYLVVVLGGTFLLGGADAGPGLYLGLFVLYLGSTFIASFFTGALMYNAREVFEGRDPTLGDGLAAAWSKKETLLVWAVISAIVGVAFRLLENRSGPIGDIARLVFGIAWGILTYFVVPVIVFEDVGAREMFERSGQTFKRTWGETAGAGFGVGIVTMLFVLVGLVVGLVLFVVLSSTPLGFVVAIGFAILLVFATYLGGSALAAIARTALYVYATEGKRPSQFDDVDFSTAAR